MKGDGKNEFVHSDNENFQTKTTILIRKKREIDKMLRMWQNKMVKIQRKVRNLLFEIFKKRKIMKFICNFCKKEVSNDDSIYFNGAVYHTKCWKLLKEEI